MENFKEEGRTGHGGVRPGAGRKPGWRSQAVATALADGLTPLEYLLQVMRDEGLEESQRMEAAKAAAPYCHPKR